MKTELGKRVELIKKFDAEEAECGAAWGKIVSNIKCVCAHMRLFK